MFVPFFAGLLWRPQPRPDVHPADHRSELQARRLQGGRTPDPRGTQEGAKVISQEGVGNIKLQVQ